MQIFLSPNYVSNMITDALEPGVAKTSATMILNMPIKEVLFFYKETFQLCAPFHCWNKCKFIFLFPNYINFTITDALAPDIAKTSATMILNMPDKEVIFFYKETF